MGWGCQIKKSNRILSIQLLFCFRCRLMLFIIAFTETLDKLNFSRFFLCSDSGRICQLLWPESRDKSHGRSTWEYERTENSLWTTRSTFPIDCVPAALREFFAEHSTIALAFSGGTDSSYLLYAAKACGANVHAYYVSTPFQPQFELDDARLLAESLHADMTVLLWCADG